MCNRTSLCLMGVVACLVLAAAWALVANPGTALGKPPRAQQEALIVDLVADEAFEHDSPLWAPTASARTVGTGPAKYHFLFDQDQDPEFVTSDLVELTDGVGCGVYLESRAALPGFWSVSRGTMPRIGTSSGTLAIDAALK